MADWASSGSGQIGVAWTSYDAAGRVWQTSVPYAEPASGSLYRPPNPSAPKTTTQYDAVGRGRLNPNADSDAHAHAHTVWLKRLSDHGRD
jgi:hypothetical protein